MKRKVKELAMKLFNDTKKKFPEIEFVNIQEHPEQVNRFWINVKADINDDRDIQINKFVSGKAINILMKEDVSFAMMVRP